MSGNEQHNLTENGVRSVRTVRCLPIVYRETGVMPLC